MVSVTTDARKLLRDVLEQNRQGDEGVAIRLAVAEEPTEGQESEIQLGMMFDEPQEGDQLVEYEGVNVLLVDQGLSGMLDGATLDAVDTPEGRQLVINQ